jgi:hypothetical protein
MKIFFSSCTDMSIQIDAWVATADEGMILMAALANNYPEHSVIMRARVKDGRDTEHRYVGLAKDATGFILEIKDLK